MILSEVKNGKVIIENIPHHQSYVQLIGMGIIKGVQIEIIKNDRGLIIVRIGNSRIAISRKITKHVKVKKVT